MSNGSTPTPIAASTLIKTGGGRIRGIFVSSASNTPLIKVWDNTAASGTVLVDTFVPVVGWQEMAFAGFKKGCYVEIGGTVKCTVMTD